MEQLDTYGRRDENFDFSLTYDTKINSNGYELNINHKIIKLWEKSFFLNKFIYFNWRLTTLQYCIDFCHTSTVILESENYLLWKTSILHWVLRQESGPWVSLFLWLVKWFKTSWLFSFCQIAPIGFSFKAQSRNFWLSK